MREHESSSEGSGLTPQTVLFIIARHKWKILLFSVLGILASIGCGTFLPAQYESKAKLLVRYVLDRSAIDLVDPQSGASPSFGGDSAIGSEVEILTSDDIALQVVDSIGLQRLTSNEGKDITKSEASREIRLGLTTTVSPLSKVITVSYKNPDPKLASEVLSELVSRYFVKHLEVHRSIGAFEFVTQQAEQVGERLRHTEAALKLLKTKAGITNLSETLPALQAKLTKTQDLLNTTEIEQAEQRARVMAMEKCLVNFGADPEKLQPASRTESHRYQTLMMQLTDARKRGLDLLARYTPESQFVKQHEHRVESLENQLRELDAKYPTFATSVPAMKGSGLNPQSDIVAEKTALAALDAKTEMLAAQLQTLQQTTERLSEMGTELGQLERQKEQEEANFKYFEGSLSKARTDEALDPTKIPNISIVQSPTAAVRDVKLHAKVAAGLAAGGIVLGLAIAFLIELVIDRTVKRPIELETALGAPLLISIPYLPGKGGVSLAPLNSAKALGPLAYRSSRHRKADSIRPFFEALRDRLVLYFEYNQLRRKPKMVAVTSLSCGAGTSTVAAGLAAALSETGDGKVLVVDMNNQNAEVHPFFKGKPAPYLAEALLNNRTAASNSETLYLATVIPPNDGATPAIPKMLHNLMPDLKASDFDYIIFDMPPINQTSATMAMSRFMDKVLLVVEAEKNDRDLVKRTFAKFLASKTDVSAVFNKSRSYVSLDEC